MFRPLSPSTRYVSIALSLGNKYAFCPLVSPAAPPRTGWFVRRTLISRLLIVQQESNVNTPITLIYSNRGRSLPIEDNLCNGAFMRGSRCVYVAIRARDPQRESTIVSIRRRIKSTKTARSAGAERNSFHVYMARDKFRMERRTRIHPREEPPSPWFFPSRFQYAFRKLWFTTRTTAILETCRLRRAHF